MSDRPDIPGYELGRELGHGGMATVYLARQQSLDREVAIKVMAAALNADREFSARFLAEARTAARLSHPGIVSVHYMSPEQTRGQAVDGRSDLYALGVVFYEMLTSQVPFDAQGSFAVGRQLITDIQRELARLGREIETDGNLDSATREAIRAFERGTDRSDTHGEATDQLLATLRSTELWPAPQPGDTFQDCPECPEMVVIPAGRFTMGSPLNEPQWRDNEGPQRQVNVPAFALGTTPVTFAQWDACLNAGGCLHRPGDEGWGRGSNPVINVSRNEAQEYADWLTQKTGNRYRLPSEAEWEYSARADSVTRLNTGNCINSDQANFGGDHPAESCSRSRYRQRTTPVGSVVSNKWGSYDMHGNVWEWVQDYWNQSYSGGPTDGRAWKTGDCNRAVARGGSWSDGGGDVRSAVRYFGPRTFGFPNRGFRVAKTLRQ
ncbi:MAG: SUMF1/EgtB/PvdO family nonheme iron enzyme [Wenzhouxiangella sp.]